MKPDIFDRIMSRKIFNPIRPFYEKYKEALLYLFFGALTFFLSMGCYAAFVSIFRWDPLFANIIDWIICVLFAYVTNRVWVFASTASTAPAIIKEMLSFSLGRVATLLMEEAMLWLGIDLLHFNDLIVKLIAQIAVIIGNYVISKLLVFRKKEADDEAGERSN